MPGFRLTPFRLLSTISLVLFLLIAYRSSPDSSPSFRPFGITSPHWLTGPGPDPLKGQEDLIGELESSPPLSPPSPDTPPVPEYADSADDPDAEFHVLPIDPNPPGPPAPEIAISHPVLLSRLQTLLTRPVLSAPSALLQNSASCPPATHGKLVNPDQYAGQKDWWASVSESEVSARRLGIVRWLEGLERGGVDVVAPELGYGAQRRGIVLTAGNADTFQRALTTVRLLRSYYLSPLPIELFSFPSELSASDIALLSTLRVTHRELTGQARVEGAWKNFHIKALAVLLSEFDEVLYLDSDVLPLREPSYLFDEELFLAHGAAFWPDINKDHPENPIWRLLGRTCDPTEWEMDSGALLISKSGNAGLNLAALHIAAHMQAEHEFWFRVSGGDKDTFRYAFWALGLEYEVAPRWLSVLGYHDDRPGADGKFCGLSMVHYDLSHPPNTLPSTPPSPLFIHANLLKHSSSLSPPSLAFQTLVHPTPDSPPSSPALDHARYFVYNGRFGGMCLDLEILEDEVRQEGAAGVPVVGGLEEDENEEEGEDEGERVRRVEEPWDEVEEGLFRDFAAVWVEEGGKVGGW